MTSITLPDQSLSTQPEETEPAERQPRSSAFASLLFIAAVLLAVFWFASPRGAFRASAMRAARLNGGQPATGAPVSAAGALADLPFPTATLTPFPAFTNTPSPTPQPTATATPTATPAIPRPPEDATQDGAKYIIVSISEQHVYAYQGDQLVYSFTASTGRGGGTLTGHFRILDKIPNAYSNPWGFWMPDWMGIYWAGPNLENGFHSLPVLANGQMLWADDIGTPITYGCVVLQPGDMQQLFDWASLGTPVEIIP